MSNPTFGNGPITHKVAAAVTKFHVVKLGAAGIALSGATDLPYGAVAQSGAPAATRADGDLSHGLPSVLAVHTVGVLPLTKSAAVVFATGDPVYVAADGKVAKTGTHSVGITVKASAASDSTVRTQLAGPFVPAPATD
ncbi:capsid cement protein [Rhodococcus qingshengii]|uniref:capsid cement protein n=1 Tax=Rhodococcus qingshengii TaxID=334542 RepID=UPI0037CB6A69